MEMYKAVFAWFHCCLTSLSAISKLNGETNIIEMLQGIHTSAMKS